MFLLFCVLFLDLTHQGVLMIWLLNSTNKFPALPSDLLKVSIKQIELSTWLAKLEGNIFVFYLFIFLLKCANFIENRKRNRCTTTICRHIFCIFLDGLCLKTCIWRLSGWCSWRKSYIRYSLMLTSDCSSLWKLILNYLLIC